MKIKKRRGFTLAEIIISVAILAVMSVYILKLFISSGQLNDEALEIDSALNYAKSVLSLVESSDNPLEIDNLKVGKVLENDDILYDIFLDKDMNPGGEEYRLNLLFNNKRESEIGQVLYDVELVISKANQEEIISLETVSIFDGGAL